MLDRTKVDKRLLPVLAEAIPEWFPELKGRAIAVSDIDAVATKEYVPTLPLVLLAIARSDGAQLTSSPHSPFEIVDNLIISFWMHPVRYKDKGVETPFWSYYPYDQIRDTLVTNTSNWIGPNQELLSYRRMTVEANSLAVVLTFTFAATFIWEACVIDIAKPVTFVGFNLCTPAGTCEES